MPSSLSFDSCEIFIDAFKTHDGYFGVESVLDPLAVMVYQAMLARMKVSASGTEIFYETKHTWRYNKFQTFYGHCFDLLSTRRRVLFWKKCSKTPVLLKSIQ